jgi:hypothetical protein
VAGAPVLDREHGARRLGVFEKERIVADAEAEQDVELGFFRVEPLGLRIGLHMVSKVPMLILS